MNPKIIDYCLLPISLGCGNIKEMISQGWTPFYGPIIWGDGAGAYQAMVKYEEVPKPDPYPEELARLEAQRATSPEDKQRLFKAIEKAHADQRSCQRLNPEMEMEIKKFHDSEKHL